MRKAGVSWLRAALFPESSHDNAVLMHPHFAGRAMTANPGFQLRRIVTGINGESRSVVTIDGPPDPFVEFAPDTGLYEIWTDHGGALDRRGLPVSVAPISLSSPPDGIKLRWTTLAPTGYCHRPLLRAPHRSRSPFDVEMRLGEIVIDRGIDAGSEAAAVGTMIFERVTV